MKWVTLLCLFLFSTAAESRHLQKRHHEGELDSIGKLRTMLGEQNLEYIVLVLLSQNLQKCSHQEHAKIIPEILEIAKHCEDHAEEEKCKKPSIEIFYDTLCKHKHLEAGYPWMHDCCAKEPKEEVKCFKEHIDVELEAYKIVDAEDACKHHKENPKFALQHTIVEMGRRHSSLSPPIILALSQEYHVMTGECCEAEDKAKCFGERMPQLKKKTDYLDTKFKLQCKVLKTFPERTVEATTLAKLSQKYAKAKIEALLKLVQLTVHMKKDCCEHDSVECMTDKLHVVEHACHEKEKLSSNLDACCEKPILKRSGCIHDLPNDKAPTDLPSMIPEFVENDHVCKDYEADKTGFLSKFLNAFAIRHQSDHYLPLVRVAKRYEEVIEKCCAGDNPPECYKTVTQMLEHAVEKSNKFAKENCEKAKESADDYILRKTLDYARRMPQLSNAAIIKIAFKMYKTAEYCCAQPEDQIKYCGEEKLNLVYAKLCEAASSLNDQVKHCCIDSYVNRRPCFMNLGVDPLHRPPALNESAFHFGEEVCKGSEEEKHHHKLELFINLVKQNPNIEKDKLKAIVVEFRKMAQTCCAEDEPKECLDRESPAIINHVKEAIGH